MKQINDNLLILTIVAAIIISMGGTFTVLTKMTLLDASPKGQITGFATNDTGYVNITIIAELSIDVDDDNDTIDFGVCNAPSSGNGTINSSYNEATLNLTSPDINCTKSNLPAYLRVLNIGNVVANITINSTRNGTSLLTSDDARIWFAAREELITDCTQGLANDWTQIADNSTAYTVCERFATGASGIRIYMNLTIPFDSSTGGANRNSTLTFQGVASN